MRSILCGFIGASWQGILCNTKPLGFVFKGYRVQCFSTKGSRARRLPKEGPPTKMEEESNAFYVVRKGDTIGIYNNLRDCQAQVSPSVCDPSVSVYKGYNLRKETEEYLASQGLKNPLYSLKAADLKEDLFGEILPCPFQQPDGLAISPDTSPLKRTKDIMVNLGAAGSGSLPIAEQSKKQRFCILEFDGASKGNPGKAGAGAILRNSDGSLICRLREGLGVVTNNVAEYRALILGMKYALKKGFKQIHVQGDSKLVCLQVEDLWRTKNQNMAVLCKEVKKLKDYFESFNIMHVKREFNSDADVQANLGVELADGEIQEEIH